MCSMGLAPIGARQMGEKIPPCHHHRRNSPGAPAQSHQDCAHEHHFVANASAPVIPDLAAHSAMIGHLESPAASASASLSLEPMDTGPPPLAAHSSVNVLRI